MPANYALPWRRCLDIHRQAEAGVVKQKKLKGRQSWLHSAECWCLFSCLSLAPWSLFLKHYASFKQHTDPSLADDDVPVSSRLHSHWQTEAPAVGKGRALFHWASVSQYVSFSGLLFLCACRHLSPHRLAIFLASSLQSVAICHHQEEGKDKKAKKDQLQKQYKSGWLFSKALKHYGNDCTELSEKW